MSSAVDARLGSQTPRLSSVPPSSSSAGQDAVDFAKSVGLTMDPWQELVLAGALGERGHRWAAFEVGLIVSRQSGKGAILEARELAGVQLFGERLILHTAHEMKTASEAFRRMEVICQDSPDIKVKHYRHVNGKEEIEFANGARIKYVARSKGSGRGFTGDLIVMDESMFLSSESMAALLPTLSTSPNPQVWYTGSAGMAESTHQRSIRDRAMTGGDPSLAYFEWSAPDDADLDDREAWAAANPAMGIRITEDFIAMERAALSEHDFARERLGIWQKPTGEQVIPERDWDQDADSFSTATDPLAFALDVTPDRKNASIAMAGTRSDGFSHVEVIENRKGTGWVAERVAELVARWRPVPLGVTLDKTGPAGSLIPDLEAVGVEVFLTSARDMTQACGRFYDEAVEHRLRHLDDPRLNSALGAARKRPLGDAWAWHRRDLTDISPLVACTLALDAHVRARSEKKPETFVPRRIR